MFEFLKKKKEVAAPVDGICIPMGEVKDSVFSSKMLGDGFAVIPSGDVIVAPVAGEIVMIPESKHAFGIAAPSGMEVLVHIGLDTVNLNGDGFSLLAKQGAKVRAGTPVIQVDRRRLTEQGYDLTTMLIFTEGYDREVVLDCYGQQVRAGQILING